MKPLEEFEVKLPSGVVYTQYVVYENFPKFCNHCFMFGHLKDNCRHLKVPTKTSENPDKRMENRNSKNPVKGMDNMNLTSENQTSAPSDNSNERMENMNSVAENQMSA